MIRKRLGPPPHAGGVRTPGASGCPDIFELSTGDFALIGRDITDDISKHLPDDASCGPDERVIQIPRRTLVLARADIPSAL
jgi:hypothetical protein